MASLAPLAGAAVVGTTLVALLGYVDAKLQARKLEIVAAMTERHKDYLEKMPSVFLDYVPFPFLRNKHVVRSPPPKSR